MGGMAQCMRVVNKKKPERMASTFLQEFLFNQAAFG
jgi:hypothetical protein